MLNEASTSTGELIARMRRSVWTVNPPALHQHDKQRCGQTEERQSQGEGGFQLYWWDTGTFNISRKQHHFLLHQTISDL